MSATICVGIVNSLIVIGTVVVIGAGFHMGYGLHSLWAILMLFFMMSTSSDKKCKCKDGKP